MSSPTGEYEKTARERETLAERVLREHFDAQAVRLDRFTALLERMFEASFDRQQASVPLTLLFASVLKARQSAQAVQLLSRKGYADEILSISRTLVEVTVNAAYFQYAGEKELQRYLKFHPETLHADTGMVRASSGRASIRMIRKVGDVLLGTLRLTRSNISDPAWAAKSLLERAELADEASKMPIMALLVERGYPRGHGAAHGTIDSLDPFIAALNGMGPAEPEEDLPARTEALVGINFCLLTLCLYLDGYFRLGMYVSIEAAATADSSSGPSREGR